MKILVTGGAGYIGSHVVLELLRKKYEVVIFDNLSTGKKENINSKATFCEGSTLNREDLDKAFKHNIDAVIHLAGSKAVGQSMINPTKFINDNIIGSLNLLVSCEQYNVSKFIFSSSASVYGNPQYLPIDEHHPTIPLNFYGETKLQIERNLVWLSKIKDFNYALLRYFNATGYDERGKIEGVETQSENLIPKIMDYIIGKKKKFEIFGYDYNTKDGTAIRDYIHVSDLACAHILSLEYLLNKNINLTLNLGSQNGASVFDIVRECELVSNKKIYYKLKSRRPGDPEILIADYKKAKKIINWIPIHSNLNNIVETTWNVYKKK